MLDPREGSSAAPCSHSRRPFRHGRGRESDRFALSESGSGGLDQATQVADAVALAPCQPGVGASFDFELTDEPGLAGRQSGLLWADGTPKPSYDAFGQAIAAVAAGRVDCPRSPAGARTAAPPGKIGFTLPRKP